MREFIKIIESTDKGVLKLGSKMTTVDLNSDGPKTSIIKLGSNPAKERAMAALNEFDDLTYTHPFLRGVRVTSNATVDVRYFDGAIHLSDISAIDLKQGGATEALKLLCDLADKYDVKITLTAKAYSEREGTMTTPQLKKWYEKFGFVIHTYEFSDGDESYGGDDEEGYSMIRYPKSAD